MCAVASGCWLAQRSAAARAPGPGVLALLVLVALLARPSLVTSPPTVIQLQSHQEDATSELPSLSADTDASEAVPLTADLMEEGHALAHPELCPALGAKIKVLILVTSAPMNAAARNAIRMSWGHAALRGDVALAFVVGSPARAHRQQIDDEDALYGDIIEGKFVDAYKNLTLKTLSMLEWATTYCPRAAALLKADDDVFVNVPLLLRFVDSRRNDTNVIWGKMKHKARPKRRRDSKYYLSRAQFAAAELPDFVTGPAYLVSRDAVPRLRAAAPAHKYLYLEDVFFTGVLASQLNISRRHSPLFFNNVSGGARFGRCTPKRRLALHRITPRQQIYLWFKLLNKSSRCSSTVRVTSLNNLSYIL